MRLAGFALGAVLLLQWHYWMISNRNWQEWLCAVMWGAACNIIFIGALIPASVYGKWSRRAITIAEVITLFGLAYINLGLVFDARYRDFPTMFLLLPVITLVIGKINFAAPENLVINVHPAYRVLFAAWMIISVTGIVWIEGFRNFSAIGWCICCLLLAWALLPRHLQSIQSLQAQTNV